MARVKKAQSSAAIEPVVVEGVAYLSIPQAQAYLGCSRATVFNRIREWSWDTYTLGGQGKRTFLRQSDLDMEKRPRVRAKAKKDEVTR